MTVGAHCEAKTIRILKRLWSGESEDTLFPNCIPNIRRRVSGGVWIAWSTEIQRGLCNKKKGTTEAQNNVFRRRDGIVKLHWLCMLA